MAAQPAEQAAEIKAELVRRAQALAPTLKERAAWAEELRQIPPETVQDLVAAELIRIGSPERYGGLGVEIDVMYHVGRELGRTCGSTAWCYSVWTIHNWIVGHFPEAAQEEFFAGGPDTICSSAFFPGGAAAEPADGGYRLSGHWSFSSGCDAASWVMVGFPSPEGLRWALVPRSDYEIVDTWFVSGMRGTGSKDLAMDDVFVPAHRVLDPGRAGDGDWTGWERHGRLSYRPPLRTILGWDLVSPIIGMAQGVVDEFTARLQSPAGPSRSAEVTANQLRLGEAAAEVDTAWVLLQHTIDEILGKAARAESFSVAERTRYARDRAYAVKLCVQAVNRLFDASGGHALFEFQPIQRLFRDVHGASHQGALNWDFAAENYGRMVLGLPVLPRR